MRESSEVAGAGTVGAGEDGLGVAVSGRGRSVVGAVGGVEAWPGARVAR